MSNDPCQAYINHLVAEHRRLHRMLVLARTAMAAEKPAWLAEFVRVLTDLRAELQCHFAEEEEGGCLDQAVSFLPNLSPEMKVVEAQHPKLLAEIDSILVQAKDRQDTLADRVALRSAFDELCRELHAHEAAENEIIRRGFGVDLGENGNRTQPATA
jgi:hemerythrin